jgi:hypothetical protein
MRLQTARISASVFVLALAAFGSSPASADSGTTLTHVHGLSFSKDGKQLMVPSHDGLAVFQDGKWVKAAGPQHDYMGFAATRDTLYSSGHPAPGSGLPNPFGLIKSSDGGKTWQKLGLEGESDFHTLATSYGTNQDQQPGRAPDRCRDCRSRHGQGALPVTRFRRQLRSAGRRVSGAG